MPVVVVKPASECTSTLAGVGIGPCIGPLAQLGTPVAVTDSGRNIIERFEYDPYGKQVSGPVKDGPGYTGHVQDAATGLTYMQQRYYDPTIGRFLSVDPVTADSATGANFNRYWYANDNPYRFTDPDGRESRRQVIINQPPGTPPPPPSFKRTIDALMSNSRAQTRIASGISRGYNLIFVFEKCCSNGNGPWRGRGENNGNNFFIIADPNYTITYVVDGNSVTLPLVEALLHELDHFIKYADRGGRPLTKQEEDQEEEEVTTQEGDRMEEQGLPRRKDHGDGKPTKSPECEECT